MVKSRNINQKGIIMKSIYMASGNGVPDPNKPKDVDQPEPAETPKGK